ncbi:MAG: translation elongation factor-like protein [Candidatus Bathyarchaeota archaeon]|nr:translation elongation factor-like protein [Candidatus Bathyarchaeota archaeon]
MEERKLEEVGEVAHYYKKIGVAIIDLKASLSVGDHILISGATTDLEQTVKSMQIQHENVDKAVAGQSIGLKVEEKVREKDVVYKVVQ